MYINIILIIVIVIIVITLLYYFVFKNSKTNGGWGGRGKDESEEDSDEGLTAEERLEKDRTELENEISEISDIARQMHYITYYESDNEKEFEELNEMYEEHENTITMLMDEITLLEKKLYNTKTPAKTKRDYPSYTYGLQDAREYMNRHNKIDEIDKDKTLDDKSMHEVMKYMKDMKDIANISRTNKENGKLISNFNYNPIPMSQEDEIILKRFNDFENIQTYSYEDSRRYALSNKPVYMMNLSYRDYIQLKQQGIEPRNLKSVMLTAKDIRYCYEHEELGASFKFETSVTRDIGYSKVGGITSLTVPNDVTYIGTGCFQHIKNAKIYIPATVSFIAENAFDYHISNSTIINPETNTIIIDPNNPYYKVENGKIVRK